MLRVCAVLLALAVCLEAAAVRERRNTDLRSLYNSRVVKAERFVRLLNNVPKWLPHMYITTHSGVRVTLQDGRKFLIHKGPNFGVASDTVITDARYMSSEWRKKGDDTLCFKGAVTVGQMVRAGGQEYSLWKLRYCHTATSAMLDLC